MEFGDFGLFELLAALIGLLSLYKYLLTKKLLRIIFSIVLIVSCIGVYILNKSDLYYICMAVASMGNLMLISILWKNKLEHFKLFLNKLIKKERYGN